jgi:hypothetical protein
MTGGQGYACGEKKAASVERISMVVSPKRKRGIVSLFPALQANP